MTLQQLLDREAIRQVHCRYARGIDRVDGGTIRSCFRERPRFTRVPQAKVVREVGGREEIVQWFVNGITRYDATQHLMANEYVSLGEGEAASETYAVAQHLYQQEGKPALYVMAIRYKDRLVKSGGEWRIQHRELNLDWREGAPPAAGNVSRRRSGAGG
ncbi:MAG: nuclear transport factor 2 family protein [Dehalococcoidia bacterium]|nr:nuclear transport factor 2 family protein [Dehalococcoidia bacterium]